jgi:hypothetical protein
MSRNRRLRIGLIEARSSSFDDEALASMAATEEIRPTHPPKIYLCSLANSVALHSGSSSLASRTAHAPPLGILRAVRALGCQVSLNSCGFHTSPIMALPSYLGAQTRDVGRAAEIYEPCHRGTANLIIVRSGRQDTLWHGKAILRL